MALRLFAFALLFTATLSQSPELIAEGVVDVTKLATDVIRQVSEQWDMLKELNLPVDPLEIAKLAKDIIIKDGSTSRRLKSVVAGMAHLGDEIRRIEDGQKTMSSLTALTTATKVWRNTQIELRLHELTDLLSRLDNVYRLMQRYTGNMDKVEKMTMEDLARTSVSHDPGSVQGLLERIHSIVVDAGDEGLLQRGVLKNLLDKESNMHMCELQQSQNQLLYNMYDTILLTEIKGYSIMQFAWMILKLYGKGNFHYESKMATERYKERTAKTILAIKDALSEANRVIWRCDPSKHVEGTTYTQLTRLLQGYIENEVDMNKDGTCKENCAFYQVTENHGCFKDQFCSRQSSCAGRILNCRYIDSDMHVCLAPKSSTRRYEYIEYENGKVLGQKGSCTRGRTQVDSWWRWGVYHCSYCLCLCDDNSSVLSDRYFSMREITAAVQQNKVITGLRFTKENRVVHLQISEGTLLPGGTIDAKSVAWRKVENIDIKRARKSVDYHEMTNEERAIDLDDLEGKKGHVLTGVRFKKIGANLNFEIQTMPFNFTTGELFPEKAEWVSNDNTGASFQPRKKLLLFEPDVPTRSGISMMNSQPDQYIEFTHSDFNMDAAQTTVPFIDTQPVISRIPMPLTGAGIYHKGAIRSGGFIAPKIFTFDYTPHIQDTFDEIAENEEIIAELDEETSRPIVNIRYLDDHNSSSNEITLV